MNIMNDKNIEQALEKALELLDNDTSQEEILISFPGHKEILKEIFSAITLLKKEKTAIVPPKELLEAILKHLPQGVTEMINSRYLYRGEKIQVRPFLNNIITNIYDLMIINWKVWAPIGIVAVVAIVVIATQFGTKAPQAPVAREERQEQPFTVKPATGNIDDAVNAILAGVSEDQALFADTEKDADLIASDSQEISDFGQSYDENEF